MPLNVKTIKRCMYFSIGLVLAGASVIIYDYQNYNADAKSKAIRAAQFEKIVFKQADYCLAGKAITLKIADTEELRSFGLQFAKSATPGMLLSFDKPQIQKLWMQYTELDLSVAFLLNNKIVEFADMKANSLMTTASSVPVDAALEMPLNWFWENGVAEGDELTPLPCVN